jgi:hypothetical protein
MVWQTRVTTISVTMPCAVSFKGRRPYIDELGLPAHEPRMEDGLFVARRTTVKDRR